MSGLVRFPIVLRLPVFCFTVRHSITAPSRSIEHQNPRHLWTSDSLQYLSNTSDFTRYRGGPEPGPRLLNLLECFLHLYFIDVYNLCDITQEVYGVFPVPFLVPAFCVGVYSLRMRIHRSSSTLLVRLHSRHSTGAVMLPSARLSIIVWLVARSRIDEING